MVSRVTDLEPKPFIKARVAWRLLQKRLGLRMLMDVVPLDATLVRGSHGRRPEDVSEWPIFLSGRKDLFPITEIDSTAVYGFLQHHLTAT